MNDKKEHFLANKKQSNMSKLLKNFKCKFCYFCESILLFIREKFCLSKEEMQDIKNEIEVLNVNANRYEKVEEHVEDFFISAKSLQLENDELRTDNKFMMMKINELYLAEIANNKLKRKIIFNELGFEISDFNLEK